MLDPLETFYGDRNYPITSGSYINIGKTSIPFLPTSTSVNDYEFSELVNEINKKIENYIEIIAETLDENPELQEWAFGLLQETKIKINRLKTNNTKTLIGAEFNIHKVHVAISKEQKIQKEEKKFRWIIPVMILINLGIVLFLVFFGKRLFQSSLVIPFLDIPISVFVWSALGSLSAVLYRFYHWSRGQSIKQIHWLIARPIFGIIMGSLAYLFVKSGLLMVNSFFGNLQNNSANEGSYLFYAVSFLVGFSDKIMNKTIDIVVGSFLPIEEVGETNS